MSGKKTTLLAKMKAVEISLLKGSYDIIFADGSSILVRAENSDAAEAKALVERPGMRVTLIMDLQKYTAFRAGGLTAVRAFAS